MPRNKVGSWSSAKCISGIRTGKLTLSSSLIINDFQVIILPFWFFMGHSMLLVPAFNGLSSPTIFIYLSINFCTISLSILQFLIRGLSRFSANFASFRCENIFTLIYIPFLWTLLKFKTKTISNPI